MKLNKKLAFTLFELLVSISIIGIMVALATVSYSAAQRKARDVRRIQDMKAVQVAAEQYYSLSGGNYPTNFTEGDSWTIDGNKVLSSFPSDPKNDSTYNYSDNCNAIGTSSYCCCARMENPTTGNSNDNCAFGTTTTHFCVKSRQ